MHWIKHINLLDKQYLVQESPMCYVYRVYIWRRNLHRFRNLRNHLLNEFALQIQNARHKIKGRLNRYYQQVLILAALQAVSSDFQREVRICRRSRNLQNQCNDQRNFLSSKEVLNLRMGLIYPENFTAL